MEETATFSLAGAAVTVAGSVLKLIDTSSGIALVFIHVSFNREIRHQKNKKNLKEEVSTRTLNVHTPPRY